MLIAGFEFWKEDEERTKMRKIYLPLHPESPSLERFKEIYGKKLEQGSLEDGRGYPETWDQVESQADDF